VLLSELRVNNAIGVELSATYEKGQQVEVGRKGKGPWRAARITKAREVEWACRAYDVLYDDSTQQACVLLACSIMKTSLVRTGVLYVIPFIGPCFQRAVKNARLQCEAHCRVRVVGAVAGFDKIVIALFDDEAFVVG
jgi:hypothetical protein